MRHKSLGAIHFIRYVIVEHLVRNDGVNDTDKRDEECRKHIEEKEFLVRLVVSDESF